MRHWQGSSSLASRLCTKHTAWPFSSVTCIVFHYSVWPEAGRISREASLSYPSSSGKSTFCGHCSLPPPLQHFGHQGQPGEFCFFNWIYSTDSHQAPGLYWAMCLVLGLPWLQGTFKEIPARVTPSLWFLPPPRCPSWLPYNLGSIRPHADCGDVFLQHSVLLLCSVHPSCSELLAWLFHLCFLSHNLESNTVQKKFLQCRWQSALSHSVALCGFWAPEMWPVRARATEF